MAMNDAHTYTVHLRFTLSFAVWYQFGIAAKQYPVQLLRLLVFGLIESCIGDFSIKV